LFPPMSMFGLWSEDIFVCISHVLTVDEMYCDCNRPTSSLLQFMLRR
jgi:hypothetical protein